MSIIAIIPARGGSKRIPRKNIKNFMGYPIISYGIKAAIESKLFDRVVVSTDDAEIAAIAQKYGAEVPFLRSKKASDDNATTFDVIDEVMRQYKKQGEEFTKFCCIYPCAPFVTAKMLGNANTLFNNYDAVMPVCKYPAPVEWAMNIEKSCLRPVDRVAKNMRSQDIAEKYYDVGMFYFCKTRAMYQFNSLIPNSTAALVLREDECQDIDTALDWRLAELKYKALQNIECDMVL
jgi:pseudaminic acid cytidylyltransferase